MIKTGNRSIGFFESYVKRLNESVDFKKVLKNNGINEEIYFKKVAEEYLNNYLMDKLFESSKTLNKEVFSKLKGNLRKKIITESNTLHIPISIFVDTINFTISTEFDNLSEEKNNTVKIKKITEMMGEEVENPIVYDLELFDEEKMSETLKNISMNITNNIEIKNNYFIVTFD
jgi:hypothetical protein